MKIFIVIIGLVLGCQAYPIDQSVDLNTVVVCTTLNNIYRTFANIWEVYSEFKATGQLWMPVAINACPITYVDCPTFTPVCAILSDNMYKTFANKCVLDAEQKATGIAWNIVLNGTCPAKSGDGFLLANSLGLSTVDNHNQASLSSHSPSPYNAQNHTSAKYEAAVQPFTYREANRNSLQHPTTLINSSISSNMNQVAIQVQSEQASSPSHSSSFYASSSFPTRGQYNPAQQTQTLPRYSESIQPLANSQVHQKAMQLSASFSPISGNPNQAAPQVQAGQDSLSLHSPSYYNSNSAPSQGQYNSEQQPHPLPSDPTPIHKLANGHAHQATVQFPINSVNPSPSGNSNRIAGLAQTAPASLATIGQYNSQSMPNYPETTQLLVNSRIHQNSAQLSSNIPIFNNPNHVVEQIHVEQAALAPHSPSNHPKTIQNSKNNQISQSLLSGNPHQVAVQVQFEEASHISHSPSYYNGPSAATESSVQQLQPVQNYRESIQPFANGQVQQNSVQVASSSAISVKPNQDMVQIQAEQSPLLSRAPVDYNSASVPAEEHYNSNQQLPSVKVFQPLPTYFERAQPVANGQFNQNSASLANSILSSVSPSNGNQVTIQAQSEQAASKSSSSMVYYGSDNQPDSAQPISSQISVNNAHAALLPVPNSCGQSNEAIATSSEGSYSPASDDCVAVTETCSSDQTYKSPEHLLASSQISNSATPNNYNDNHQSADASSETNYCSTTAKPSAENVSVNPQNEGQTIYNGVVYQGPYYYEPKYKHIYFDSFNFAPAPESVLMPLTNKKSTLPTANSKAAALVTQYSSHPFQQLLKQLQYIASGN